jgi:hypothetical protein
VWTAGGSTIFHGTTPQDVSPFATVAEANVDGIWGPDPDDAWAVGAGGRIHHWDGAAWSSPPGGAVGSYYGIQGTSAADIWAVGDQISHWDGVRWNDMPVPEHSLHSVWAVRPDRAWAVGDYGQIVRWDGTSWTIVRAGGTQGESLLGVWGTGDTDVWAVGHDSAGGEVLHDDGTGWTVVLAGQPSSASSVWGAGGQVFVGFYYAIMRYDGTSWSSSASTAEDITALTGTGPNDVWAVQSGFSPSGFKLLHWDGASWSDGSPGLPGVSITSVAVDPVAGVWVAGLSGTLATLVGGTWQVETGLTYNNLEGVFFAGSTLRAVGQDGTILRREIP